LVAIVLIIILGIGFSLVPSAMWPSVPKIIPEKQIGSAYAFIFWIQNFGLWGIPLLIGIVLERTNPGVSSAIQNVMKNLRAENLSDEKMDERIALLKEANEYPVYNYETTWIIFVGLTVLALIVALMLKAEDKKKGYGLELPNIEK
jgi:MFS family permease